MEALKNQIIGLSSQDTLQQLLNALKASEGLLDQGHGAIAGVLAELDPVQHSLGYLYLLNAHARHLDAPQGDQGFIEAAGRFLRDCAAAQIQLAPALFAELCRRYRDQVIAAGAPRLGILPLLSALQRLRPSAEHLTPMHADVLQLCLLSKAYNAAAPLLAADVSAVEPARTGVTPTDLLLYCYYGGMAAAGRKQWVRALELWLQAVTAPTYVGNAITVACYKKFVLGSLIHTGSLRQLPRFTSSRVRQAVESEGKAYAELAAAYSSFNRERLRKAAEHHLPAFQLDGNLGLVKQVLASAPARAIQRLTRTFLTLSLSDIAAHAGLAGPERAEAEILRMVESGQVHARIDEATGMVTFSEDPEAYTSAGTAATLDAAIARAVELSERVASLNEAVLLEGAYAAKVAARERSAAGHFGGGGGGGGGGGALLDELAAGGAFEMRG
ncbi:MAG: hypothetical protein J3K34DRAFT_99745 [Monoraphidium minutum]|nr:MAG: hypothetical protein J3K34DRAFT_99745 [Monoraphidium minutum]